jgi:hypothetical protein
MPKNYTHPWQSYAAAGAFNPWLCFATGSSPNSLPLIIGNYRLSVPSIA